MVRARFLENKRSAKTIASLRVATALLLSMLMSAAPGCTDDEPEQQNLPVIEAYLASDGHPVVLFTSSVTPEKEGNLDDIVYPFGRVSITDGETTAVMSAGPDGGYLPPYRYHTTAILGEPGKRYTVSVKFQDKTASATAYMPFPTPIDSLTVTSVNDTLRAATLHFTAPADCPAFYYISMAREGVSRQQRPCMLGVTRADKPGEHIAIPVFHPRDKIDGVDFVSQLIVGEKLDIRLNRVDENVYNFWKAYDNMVNFSATPFISTGESLPTNVTGGYGVFTASGCSKYYLEVK